MFVVFAFFWLAFHALFGSYRRVGTAESRFAFKGEREKSGKNTVSFPVPDAIAASGLHALGIPLPITR